MNQVGDGPEGQPTEGVVTLDSLAAGMDGDDVNALEESAGSEAAEDSEGVEDSEEAQEQAEEAQEEPTLVLKHDGKEVTLKQSEVLELAQKGFDYTHKTMALAEDRKAIEPIKQQAEEYRQQQESVLKETVDRLQAYAAYMANQVGQPPPITLAQEDAARYLAEKELYEARKGQLHQAYAEIQRLSEEQARQRQAWISQKAESTEKALRDTLPGWNDDSLGELARYAEGLGLTPQSADLAMLEPGFWQLAHKAKAYDALQAEKAKLKPVAQLPKVQKPSAGNQPPQLARRQEAFKRHKSAPSLNTLADLL